MWNDHNTVVVQSLVCFCPIILLSTHVWLCRASLVPRDFAHSVCKFFYDGVRPVPSQTPPRAGIWDASLDQIRMKYFRILVMCCRTVSAVVASMVFFNSSVVSMHPEILSGLPLFELIYAAVLAVGEFQHCFSVRIVYWSHRAFIGLFAIRMIFAPHDPRMLVHNTSRAAARLAFALPTLDHYEVVSLSIVASLATSIACFRIMAGSDFLLFVLSEGFVVIGICSFTKHVLSLVLAEARLAVQSDRFDKTRQAASKLLSATCDAQFHLSVQMTILQHSPSLLGILQPGDHCGQSLSGSSLAQYLTEDDCERFHKFVQSSGLTRCDTIDTQAFDAGTPSLIHLLIRTIDNSYAPAELVCVSLPTEDNEPALLVGISMHAERTAQDAKTDYETFFSTAGDHGASEFDSVPSVSNDAYFVSSWPTKSPIDQVQAATIILDGLSERLLIKKITFHFATEWPPAAEAAAQLPSLMDWLEWDTNRLTEAWIQKSINSWASGGPEVCSGHGAFQLSCDNCPFITASDASMEIEGKEHSDDSLQIALHLHGVSRVVWNQGLPGLPLIEE